MHREPLRQDLTLPSPGTPGHSTALAQSGCSGVLGDQLSESRPAGVARTLTANAVSLASSRNASVQDGSRTPLSSTFQQTEGGRTGPYKATAFDLTPCSDLPSLDAVGDVARASEILNAYLVRVGANGTCLSDPNFQGLCNPPLSAATEYRWV